MSICDQTIKTEPISLEIFLILFYCSYYSNKLVNLRILALSRNLSTNHSLYKELVYWHGLRHYDAYVSNASVVN